MGITIYGKVYFDPTLGLINMFTKGLASIRNQTMTLENLRSWKLVRAFSGIQNNTI